MFVSPGAVLQLQERPLVELSDQADRQHSDSLLLRQTKNINLQMNHYDRKEKTEAKN